MNTPQELERMRNRLVGERMEYERKLRAAEQTLDGFMDDLHHERARRDDLEATLSRVRKIIYTDPPYTWERRIKAALDGEGEQ